MQEIKQHIEDLKLEISLSSLRGADKTPYEEQLRDLGQAIGKLKPLTKAEVRAFEESRGAAKGPPTRQIAKTTKQVQESKQVSPEDRRGALGTQFDAFAKGGKGAAAVSAKDKAATGDIRTKLERQLAELDNAIQQGHLKAKDVKDIRKRLTNPDLNLKSLQKLDRDVSNLIGRVARSRQQAALRAGKSAGLAEKPINDALQEAQRLTNLLKDPAAKDQLISRLANAVTENTLDAARGVLGEAQTALQAQNQKELNALQASEYMTRELIEIDQIRPRLEQALKLDGAKAGGGAAASGPKGPPAKQPAGGKK